MRRAPLWTVATFGLCLTTPAAAGDAAPWLPEVVVSSARLRAVDAFDTPASLSVVELDAVVAPPATVAAALAGVPGVLARDRQNLAQDTQLSVRGFGARATFGVRGLRVYADGIPATMPDGQAQVSHFNLFAAERIDVLRGPFSALYGNSAGGVVQIVSAEPGIAQMRVQAAAGEDGQLQFGLRTGGRTGALGYSAALLLSDSDGYREHSAARRESANLRLRVPLGEEGRLDLVANHFDSPDAQDPLGLTRAELLANPRAATPAALQYDTRKSAAQDQIGGVLERALSEASQLRVAAYAGRREIEQFLAIPPAAQANPLHAGGVVDLAGDYGGIDLRLSWQGELAARPLQLVAGFDAEGQRQHRRGYENVVGTALGVRGALRRDEINRADARDGYVQAYWSFSPRWTLLAGLRRSELDLRADDRYVTPANPDDSGSTGYAGTLPAASLRFAVGEDLGLYVSAGRGLETPTFNELSYRADGGAGLAFTLAPARSRHLELGAKWRGRAVSWEAALFRADTDDELAVARNVGGRSSYRNVGRARREGAELAAWLPLGERADLALSYTRLHAVFRDTFPLCTAGNCAMPTARVAAGTRLPGLPATQLSLRLAWRRGPWEAAAQGFGVSDQSVNDAGTARAPGYGLLNVELGRRWASAGGAFRGFLRVDNAFDRRYVGSVIVNEGNGRYYEPGADRTVSLGLRWDSRD